MKCPGQEDGTSHCCYVNGKPCRYVERGTVPGRTMACGLRRRLGSWAKVHRHPGYLAHVRPVFKLAGISHCGDWPNRARRESCSICGVGK